MSEMQEQTPPLPGAGWELDKLVAEKQGFRVVKNSRFGDYTMELATEPGHYYEMPSYSTDIGAAWGLVRIYVGQHSNGKDWPNVSLSFGPNGTVHCTLAVNMSDHEQYAIGTTEAHAICLAFLALPDDEVQA